MQPELIRRLSDARLYIEEHLFEPLRIEQLAAVARVSSFHFIRSFKEVFGASPHQYLIEQRLQAAKGLLQQGASVSQIAFDCGFADVYSFSKSFKKKFGVAPTYFH